MPTEVRYTDANFWTVNGLTARKHITDMDSTGQFSYTQDNILVQTMYCAIRAWIRDALGNETEIGDAGTYKAIASGTPGASKSVIYGTWTYPTVSPINSTDCIKVNFYMRLSDSSFSEADLAETFVTEQLGAQSLDTNTLTVGYMIQFVSPTHSLWFGWYLLYGEYLNNSLVSGWKWTPYVPPPPAVVKKPIWECKTRGGQKQERACYQSTLTLGS